MVPRKPSAPDPFRPFEPHEIGWYRNFKLGVERWAWMGTVGRRAGVYIIGLSAVLAAAKVIYDLAFPAGGP